MASTILHPPAHLPPAVALQLSQQAPNLLKNSPSSIEAYSLGSIFAAAESPELWTSYENLLFSCLRTGDEKAASLCLDRLSQRFGVSNERVMALRGLFQEAIAHDNAALKKVLKEYEKILVDDPSNTPISKRRIALLKSLDMITEAIAALNEFLISSPTDAEAWAELADLYASQGLYPQAIFSLEEVLLVTPYAWNIHARLGEILYMAATANDSGADKYLVESLRRFCRSVELCDDYLRGYYGLKLTSDRLLKLAPSSRQTKADAAVALPDTKIVERLNENATAKLSEIIRRSASVENGYEGYNDAEVIAAQALLNLDASAITR